MCSLVYIVSAYRNDKETKNMKYLSERRGPLGWLFCGVIGVVLISSMKRVKYLGNSFREITCGTSLSRVSQAQDREPQNFRL